ncbi:FkbM family methyltransferase [Rhizobium sp. CSW-27]|uniref:FkbM family methyltransferase n=1 Tax=Rhizobium sp. CSW-27 TaxID=2839985 RepID=UPI001C018299|nr:FkbM family methyltransferase [Rhizobium sp. CSW-27]MBT9371988.1 FkbM family methyltransferase [Rhizobium sp. CSW-27]
MQDSPQGATPDGKRETMFTSYAQNFEDVILWRAFSHIDNGFYIDIGAQDPVTDSVSCGFYERGWRGVSIEPVHAYAEKMRDARPDEVVIEAAVGTGPGPIAFYCFPETGLSTADRGIAERHRQSGLAWEEVHVDCLSLESILEMFADRTICWLKIDVEGMEKDVLSSWGKSEVRPFVVVIEATAPSSRDRTDHGWAHLLESRGYQARYFDGLNCFYIHENAELDADAFGVPPNVFDGFVLSGTSSSSLVSRFNRELPVVRDEPDSVRCDHSGRSAQVRELTADIVRLAKARMTDLEREIELRQKLSQTEEQLRTVQGGLSEAEARRNDLARELQAFEDRHARYVEATEKNIQGLLLDVADWTHRSDLLHQQVMDLRSSFSWRITSPYRMVSASIKRAMRPIFVRFGVHTSRIRFAVLFPLRFLKNGSVAWLTFKPNSRPHRIAVFILHGLYRKVRRSPDLQLRARRLVSRFPGVERFIRKALLTPSVVVTMQSAGAGSDPDALTETEHILIEQIVKAEQSVKYLSGLAKK